MPREPRAMDKDRSFGWDVVVIVDEESQVRHCFVAAIRRNAELCWVASRRAIDIIGANMVFVFQCDNPGSVTVRGDSGDYQGWLGCICKTRAYAVCLRQR
jgi:hypothetical protein